MALEHRPKSGFFSDCKFQPAFDSVKSLTQIVSGRLLLRIGCSKCSEVLDDRGLPTFEIAHLASEVVNLSLDAAIASLEPLEVFR